MNTARATIPIILSQHAENLAFLWLLRDQAVRAPHYSLTDLARLDNRIEAHLDGLLIAGEEGWRICVEELKWEEPGEVFAASAVAFMSGDIERMQPVLEAARKSPELTRGMIAALGFLPHVHVMDRIAQLSDSKSSDLRFIGLSASAIQRIDPGNVLTQSLESDDPRLRGRARKAAGELGRRDLLPALRAGMKDTDSEARFWAAWSLGVLGDRGVVDALREFVVADFNRSMDALSLATRLMDVQQGSTWRHSLAADSNSMRFAILEAGASGDPTTIPWLIDQMSDKALTRVAGESFTSITGADLALQGLELAHPDDSNVGPNDNPADESVSMDQDENLPWPDVALVHRWWASNSTRFSAGQRYLLGEPILSDSLQRILRIGKQRQRVAAALELTLSDSKAVTPLFEVRANARTQQVRLGLITSSR